jgi:hypothetical protein
VSLTRDQIFAARPWPSEEVHVPEWGGSVRVRALSASEMDDFNASITRTKKDQSVEVNRRNYRAKLVAKCVVNGDGTTPMFKEESDIVALGLQPASALDRILEAINRLNGMTVEDQEDAVKN